MNYAMLKGYNLLANEVSKKTDIDIPTFGLNLKSKEISTFDDADKYLHNKGTGFVKPHGVSGYTRADGTKVKGYWRDGDGNPNTNLTLKQGGGYYR